MKRVEEWLISVIVPVYNIEEYVGNCIQSIIEQTYTNIQIILVDDGSKDTSGEICDSYATRDSRIQVIHKKNGGLVSARKAGLAVAKGDYIGFVDGDDYVEHGFFETLLNLIVTSKSDFIHTGYIREQNGNSAEIIPLEEGIYDLVENNLKIIKESVLDKFEITPSIWSKLFRSDFIKECYAKVPNEQSQGEDLICLCVCLLRGRRMSLHKFAMYHYNIRDGALTNYGNASDVAAIAGHYNVLKNVFEDFGVYNLFKQSLEAHYLRMTMLVMKSIKEIASSISLYYFGEMDKLIGKRIIIYGAGNVGRDFYAQISRYQECEIVGWLDSNYSQFHFEYGEVKGISELQGLKYDAILIAVKYASVAMRIKNELISYGVNEEKIMWKEPREII